MIKDCQTLTLVWLSLDDSENMAKWLQKSIADFKLVCRDIEGGPCLHMELQMLSQSDYDKLVIRTYLAGLTGVQ